MTKARFLNLAGGLLKLAIIATILLVGAVAVASRASAAVDITVHQERWWYWIEIENVTNGSAWIEYARQECAPLPLVGTPLFRPELCVLPRWECAYLDDVDAWPDCMGLCWCGVSAWADMDHRLVWPWPDEGVPWGRMVLAWREPNTAPDRHDMLVWWGPADWNADERIDVFDLLDYLDDWFQREGTEEEKLMELLWWLEEWF